jgi:hypothetical protein
LALDGAQVDDEAHGDVDIGCSHHDCVDDPLGQEVGVPLVEVVHDVLDGDDHETWNTSCGDETVL